MRYLTYEEYREIGGTLDLTAFNRNIDRACGLIDNETHSRIEAMAGVPQEAKALCRDLTEYFEVNSITEGKVVSHSQSAGNVSESKSYAAKTKEEQAQEVDNMILDYLASVEDDNGIPLLYRGYGI